MPTNRLTGIKKLEMIWKKYTSIQEMSPKHFRKISHPEVEISLYLSIFSKKVSQLTDWQTYKKFRIIRYWSRNILGMSPKDFRKISHLEPKILNSLVNWPQTDTQTDTQTDKCKSRAGPTRGGPAKKIRMGHLLFTSSVATGRLQMYYSCL